MSDSSKIGATLVMGMGRFGGSLAVTLDKLGREVLAVDTDPRKVEKWTGVIPVVEADPTNAVALQQLGAADFPVAVVGVGSSIEASVLITANLVDLGTPDIWAKAISTEHGKILKRIGAHHVVYPEADAGQRVAHMVSGRMMDFIEMEDGFAIVKMRPPRELHGTTVGEVQIRKKYGINVLGVKSHGKPFEYATGDTEIHADDVLIVSGDTPLLDRFAMRP